MSAITKERIELFIKNQLDNGLTRGEQMEVARIALASLEAEPNFDINGNSPATPDGWIPVSERMPEPYEYVLVTDGFDGCDVMRVNTDGYWGPARSLYPGSITHWMPLPAAPQQEDL